jgi:hypothetical protein
MFSRGGSVLAPPGVVMVAPSEVPRNAEGRKVKAALVEDDPVPQYNAANNTSIIKAGGRKPRTCGCQSPTGAEGGSPSRTMDHLI